MNRFDDDNFNDEIFDLGDLEKLRVIDERKFTWPAGEKIEMKNSFTVLAMTIGKEEMKQEYLKRENFYAHYVGYLEPNENLGIITRDEDTGDNDNKE